jgi:hypothetical protein
LDALEELRGEWARCELEELRDHSPLVRAAIPRTLDAHLDACSVCPMVDLNRPLPSRVRRSVHQAEKKLGTFEFGPGDWDQLVLLHERRWGGQGMLISGAVREFHRQARSSFTRLYALRSQGSTIAVIYLLIAKGRACAYLSGYDVAWAEYSPGSVLLRYAMEQARQEGAQVFDFLRHGEAYKYAWGAQDEINRRLVLTVRPA